MKTKITALIIVLLLIGYAWAATRSLVPRADGEGGLGTSAKNWGTSYIETMYADVLTVAGSLTTAGSVTIGSGTLRVPLIAFTDENASPSAVGEFRYDNTVTGLIDGALCWYDDDAIRYLVDLDTLPTNDDYVVSYDAVNDEFYMKADADSGGATAWDNITNPTGADEIDFGAHVTELNVADFRVGDGGANYIGFDGTPTLSFHGNANMSTVTLSGSLTTTGSLTVSSGVLSAPAATISGAITGTTYNGLTVASAASDFTFTTSNGDSLKFASAVPVGWSLASPAAAGKVLSIYASTSLNQDLRTTDSPTFAVLTISGSLTTAGSVTITGGVLSFNGGDLDPPDDSIDDADINWGTGANQISIADLSGTQTSGAIVWDFTSATTTVPWKVSATATPTVEGQAIWESDTDELTVGDGTVSVVIAAKTRTVFAFNIHDIDTGMDDIKMPFTRATTITKVTVFVTGGTNVVGRLYEVDSDGDDSDAVGVETSDWTFTTGETEDSSFNNATFDAGDYIQWDTTSVSGVVTGFMISVEGYEI